MDYVTEWVRFFISFFQTCVQWLGSMQLLGVPLLWIIIAGFLLLVLVRAFIMTV